jgi:hypothetical protein
VLRAREIFSRDGWRGLEEAAKRGLVPASAVAAVLGGGLLGDPQTQ